jgi:formimidoylglutamate deiminase
VAGHLYRRAVSGGALASARNITGLAVGQRADLVVLDPEAADAVNDPDATLSAWIFAHHGAHAARDVMAGGRWVVKDGYHVIQDAVLRDYVRARDTLLAAVHQP